MWRPTMHEYGKQHMWQAHCLICKVVSLGAVTVTSPFTRIWQTCPVSKGVDHVGSLSCLRHVWRMWTFRLYHHHQNSPELLYCPAGHCHWCGELLFAVIYSKLFPPLERDTDGRALWEDNCCVIAVTGKSEDRLSIFDNDLNMLCLPRKHTEIKQLWNGKSGTFMLSRCAAFGIRFRKGLQVGPP